MRPRLDQRAEREQGSPSAAPIDWISDSRRANQAKKSRQWQTCREVAEKLCARGSDAPEWRHAHWIGCSLLANAFSQAPELRLPKPGYAYRQALGLIGRGLAEARHLPPCDPQSAASLANALAKCLDLKNLPDEAALRLQCVQGIARIADEVGRGAKQERLTYQEEPQLREFQTHHLAQLCNGLSKALQHSADDAFAKSCEALGLIGRAVVVRSMCAGLSALQARTLAMMANGFEHLFDKTIEAQAAPQPLLRGAVEDGGAALGEMGREVAVRLSSATDRLPAFNPQDVAMLTNALSKAPQSSDSVEGLMALGREMVRRDGLRGGFADYTDQQLSMVVHGLAKAFDENDCRSGLIAVGREVGRRADAQGGLPGYDARNLSMLVGGLAKASEDPHARDALLKAGCEVVLRAHAPDGLSRLSPQCLAMLAKGLSAVVGHKDGMAGLVAIGRELERRNAAHGRLREFKSQELGMLANGLSTVGEEGNSPAGLSAVSEEVLRRADLPGGWSDFGNPGLALLANGLAKGTKNRWNVRALCAIGREVAERFHRAPGGMEDIDGQQLSMLANGLGKVVEDSGDSAGLLAVSHEFARRERLHRGLSDLSSQGLALAAINLAKVAEDDAGAAGLAAVGRQTLRRSYMDDGLWAAEDLHLAMLASGLSKMTSDRDCRSGLLEISKEVARRDAVGDGLACLTSQSLSVLTNALGRLAEDGTGASGLLAISREVARRADATGRLPGFGSLHLAFLASGLGRAAANNDVDAGLLAVSQEVAHRADAAGAWSESPQYLAMLANGLSRPGALETAQMDMQAIAESLGAGGHAYAMFDQAHLAQLANALSRAAMWAEDGADESLEALMRGRLHELTAHLIQAPERLTQFSFLSLSVVLKALAKTGLYDDLAALARPALQRLEALHLQTGLRTSNLETVSGVCVGLLPFLRSKEPGLRRHRRSVLELLERLQPLVERKIALALAHGAQAEDAGGRNAAGEEMRAGRQLGRSLYLTLKTYVTVAHQWRWRHVGGTPQKADARRASLEDWLKGVAARAGAVLDGELGAMGWAVQALIESDEVTGALHHYLHAHAAQIEDQLAQAGQTPTPIRLDAVAAQWRHSPRVPHDGAGVCLPSPRVDSFGRPVARGAEEDASKRYTVLARLTRNMPVIEVELESPPSAFQLERTVTHDNVPYCFNLFGGSAAKLGRSQFEDMQDQAAQQTRRKPKFVGVRVCDMLPDAPFVQMLAKLFPNKESFWYFQRLMKPSPPQGIPGLGPADHVLEGQFRMCFMPDIADRTDAAIAHPFKLRDRSGRPVAVQPYDGCGFIKASVAERMPAYRRAMGLEGGKRLDPIGHSRASHMSLSALQHYAPNDAVAEEAVRSLQRTLPDLSEEPRGETLFRCAVNGLMQGKTAILVAATDDSAHLPAAKSADWDGADLLIGKSPYDQANMVVFAPERIGTEAGGDATAQFLGRCAALQYSYVGVEDAVQALDRQDPAPARAEADKPWFGLKGIDIVVPDAMWPAEYADCDRVGPAKDVKVHSDWQQAKAPVERDTNVESRGVYVGTEVYAPGSLAALPLHTIKRLDADCDGDPVQLFAGRPALSQYVREAEQERQAHPKPSFKPPKTHTPAIDPHTGAYDPSRTTQILAIYKGAIQAFTGLQVSLLAQTPEIQTWVAERAVIGTYEGTDSTLGKDLRKLLEADVPDPVAVARSADAAATDVERALYPPARHMAELLRDLLAQWRDGKEQPLALPAAMHELLPRLATAYEHAGSTRERLQAVVDLYPRRKLESRLGYESKDVLLSLHNLLSIGIKVGTDSYKSDTATGIFSKCAESLKNLLCRAPGYQSVPYTKGAGRRLVAGRLEARAVLDDLEGIPTLAARVMQRCSEHLVEKGLWPRSGQWLRPITPKMREQAAEQARQLAAKARCAEPATRRLMEALLETFKHDCQPALTEKRLRSQGSLQTYILSRMRNDGIDANEAAQQVRNALRYTIVSEPEKLVRTVRKMVDEMEARGFRRVRQRNAFVSGTTYKGIVVHLQLPRQEADALPLFQVEFHTPQSLLAKQELHGHYKRSQAETLAEAPDPKLLQSCSDAMRERCAQVPVPPGANQISDYSYFGHAQPRRARIANAPRTNSQRAAGNEAPSMQLAKQLQRFALDREPTITAAVGTVVERMQQAAGAARVRLNVGDHGKSWKSIRSKIEMAAGKRPKVEDRARAAAHVLDGLRYEVVIAEEVFAAQSEMALQALRKDGMTLLRVKNAFAAPLSQDNPYRGINAIYMDEAGQAFEVQLHTPASADAKKMAHTAYKVLQKLQAEQGRGKDVRHKQPSFVRNQEANASAWQGVRRPPGAASIPPYQAAEHAWEMFRAKLRDRLGA
ncbi:hypothetical protein FZ025_10775 [Xanthomonas hyacinthi]|uniref:hypothetical protein n=1 Tax=Xanthomonas hyacinthi TaxID=56455 RepID=UPI0013030083|nr:hypothetical protein [Xanthomonas hyacinthi]QGY77098.1 hypothetical protein FZ025_10775 [Xanthomonas hyacinthi]